MVQIGRVRVKPVTVGNRRACAVRQKKRFPTLDISDVPEQLGAAKLQQIAVPGRAVLFIVPTGELQASIAFLLLALDKVCRRLDQCMPAVNPVPRRRNAVLAAEGFHKRHMMRADAD